MQSVLNDMDTERKRINKEVICDSCKYPTIEGNKISYVSYKQSGGFLTPDKRIDEIVCDNCLDEHY